MLRTIGGKLPIPEDMETPLMPVAWTPSFRTLVMFVLFSTYRILAPESTRTRRVLFAPPNVVTLGESAVVVKIEGRMSMTSDLEGRMSTTSDLEGRMFKTSDLEGRMSRTSEVGGYDQIGYDKTT